MYEPSITSVFKTAVKATKSFVLGPGHVTASTPHIVDELDTRRYMTMVVLALLPISLGAVYHFGWRFLAAVFVAYFFGGVTEIIFAVVRQKEFRLEALLITGLLFPLILPPTVPLWIVAVGTVFGIVFGKEAFGGTGRNIFNPAIVGRVFVTAAFPLFMTGPWQVPFTEGLGGFLSYNRIADAVTAATPLMRPELYSYADLLLGRAPGSMGETFRLLIILSGIFLMVVKVSNWRIPVAYLGSVALFSLAGNMFFEQFAPPLIQLLSGGLLLGAFFMATDPVTSPFTRPGKLIYGVSLGLLTVLIRGLTENPEGVMFSILIMNAFAPLIDSAILKHRFKPIKHNGVVCNE